MIFPEQRFRLKDGRTCTLRAAQPEDAEAMLATVETGMVPKLEACIRAVRGGVPHTHVVNGTRPHSILLEIFTDEGIGTMITSGGRW